MINPPSPPELTPARLAKIRRHQHYGLECATCDLLAEIDRLKAEKAQLPAWVHTLHEERDRLRSALEGKVWEPTLEAALRNYGRHMDNCKSRFYENQPCTCGLAALLDRLGPQEPV